MNEFLKTREQINASTQWLVDNGYTSHPISCKDFELALTTQALRDGDVLDAGADGSFLLHNAVKKNITGRKVGIDLIEVVGGNAADGVEYFKGDIMATPFDDESFDMVFSLSVLEHQVDFTLFAKEMSRLLRKGGNLYVSFDYAEKKIDTSLTKLYSLDWNILSREDAAKFIDVCAMHGLVITDNVDWTVQDMVINSAYCAPVVGVEYTFGIFNFIKK